MKKYSLFSNFRFEYGILWRQKKDLFFASLAEILLSVITPVFASWVTAYVVQLVIDKTPAGRLFFTIFAAFIGYGAIAAVKSYLQKREYTGFIEVRLSNYMYPVYKKIVDLRLDALEAPNMRVNIEKSLMANGTNHWGNEGFYHNMTTFLTRVLGLATFISIIGAIHPMVLLLLLITAIVSSFASYGVNSYYEKHYNDEAKENMTMKYIDRLTDQVSGGKDIRVFALTDWIIDKYQTAIRNVRRLNFKGETIRFGRDTLDNVFAFLRNLICYTYLIFLLRGGMPIAEFVFFIGMIGGFATWLEHLARTYIDLLRDSHMISDYRCFLDIENGYGTGDREKISEKENLDIVFDHVTFQYPGAENAVIKDVSFHIKQGEKIALVGVNGAGKSTIVKLMSGLYLPNEGRVLVNGIDTKKLDLQSYYAKEAAVFQDAFATAYSIAENIALSEEYEEEKIWDALKKAGLHTKVKSLHKGIDTCLGTDIEEDGVQLSGGEMQKLLLARALYKNPKIVILDEPTAALDALAEADVYQTYEENLKGASSLYISHRLASTKFCDRILLLNNGVIEEAGTHEELMALHGTYTKMFQVQSQYYKEGNDGTK